MIKRNNFAIAFAFLAMLTLTCGSSEKGEADMATSSNYEDLVSLYKEFREFAKPKLINDVPDYTAAAVETQKLGLKKFQSRLAAIDPSGWPVSQQVDYHLVRAETNGLDFYHRVLRPWSRNPAFYGTRLYGFRRIPKMPLSEEAINDLRMKLQAIPEILKQAKGNLTEMVDLSRLTIYNKEREKAMLNDLSTQLAKHHPDLVPDVEKAQAAIDNYIAWIKENKSKMAKHVGVGKENYNWWLKNVWLFPYNWDDCWAIEQREYERAVSTLKFYENKNRNLPPDDPVKTEEEFNRLWKQSEDYYLNFVREEGIFTIPDYLVAIGPEPFKTWATNPGRYGPVNDFFEQLGDRDPLTEIIHNTTGHNFDGLRYRNDPRPIRGARRLFGVDRVRSEGIAFGLEEMMLQAGLFDKRERGNEICAIAMAYRAVRGMADLKMHSNEFTFDEACQFDADWCPRDYVTKYSFTMMGHKGGTPNMPGNEISYLMGKIQVQKLIADRAMQLGDKFNIREFFDKFFEAGMTPIALIRWEMTGFDNEIKKLR